MTISTVEEAIESIETFVGKPEEFSLQIPLVSSLTFRNKQMNLNFAMALITDTVLKKGWMPNGYEDKDDFRHYKYKQL